MASAHLKLTHKHTVLQKSFATLLQSIFPAENPRQFAAAPELCPLRAEPAPTAKGTTLPQTAEASPASKDPLGARSRPPFGRTGGPASPVAAGRGRG